MARNRKQYDDDDGRTIVDMDVEGMPWHDRRMRKEDRARADAELKERIARGETLNDRQTARAIWYALLAGFAVIGVIGGVVILFVLILWLCWR